jgi:hypothetical protein
MKRCHVVLAAAAIFLGTISAFDARAAGGAGHFGGHRGGHWGGGPFFAPFDPRVILGTALLAPLLYPPPPAYPYHPAPVAVPPPVYVQPYPYPSQPVPQAPQYWYYCASAKLYHPYTEACPEGWQQIPRQPLF